MSKQCSRDHYRELCTSGDCATKKDQLYVFLRRNPNLTRNEIAQGIGWPLSSVCGRAHELMQDGAVEESKKLRPCSVTGKKVHTLEALSAEEMHQADMFKRAG